jgi:ABC-2 type transport system ATP-binding protein
MAAEPRPTPAEDLAPPPDPSGALSPVVTLEARRLRATYGSRVALEDLSFTARAGEVLGLLGPNGAGKTTAIRVLTTIVAPTAGTFAVAGIPPTRPAEIRRRVGVLPESAGYPETQTATEYLRYFARLDGHSRAGSAAAAATLLTEVGLAGRASSPIAHLSRGMRQRLGIARALIGEPAVVFLDEPTIGLDPAGQAQVLRMVERIAHERAVTVVLSTHFLAEVEDVCSRVLILNRGRVVADGTVAEVTRRAAAPRRGRFRVPVDLRPRALDALGRTGGVTEATPTEGRPDWVTVTLDEAPAIATAPRVRIDAAAQALAEAGIPVLAFELEGARLSDAFLSMTAES